MHDTNAAPTEKELSQNEHKHEFRDEMIRFAFIFLLIIVPLRIFVAQPFVVSGASMDPTFGSGDYLIVDQVTPKFGKGWQRYDVVVFKFPFEKSRFLIKRIIGLPGETVEGKNGVITIFNEENPDGIVLDESYIVHTKNDDFSTEVAAGTYFVMGDNREGSYDSRAWGTLSEDLLIGRPVIRLFPFSAIDINPGLNE